MAVTDIKPTQLIINKVSREKYKELSAANQLCADQVYIVKDLQLNAVSLKIINVGTPETSADAANKAYVDDQISDSLSSYYKKNEVSSAYDLEQKFAKYTIINKVTQAEYDTLSAAGQIKEDELYVITDLPTTDEILCSRLSSYYKKTETSSNAQLTAEFAKYQPSGDYRTGSQISTIASTYATNVENKLTAYETTADLTANYYKKTDTSSNSQLTTEFAKYQPSGDYRTGSQISTIASTYANNVDSKLTAYETKADLTANYYNKTQANQISTDLSTGIMENTSRVFIRKWSD